MDLLSWLAGSDTLDDTLTPRTLNSSSHSGVYRRSDNAQAVKRKPCNPGIYSGGNGKARGGCLAGMRGFEPILETPAQSMRAARSLSPQKVRTEPFRTYGGQEFWPSNLPYEIDHSLPRTRSLAAQGNFFNTGGYPQSYQQAHTFQVYERPSQSRYLFRAAPSHDEPARNQAAQTTDASPATGMSVATGTSNSTSVPKVDVTPSTSDHSDVDDLAPRSIHSPSTSDAQTPPSSGPGSPAVPKAYSSEGAGSGSDSSEKLQILCPKEDPTLAVKKSPFASLDLKDQGIVKARTCTRNALQLNRSLTGECRNLEDEMSDLTKDLERLRAQLKNHRQA